MSKALLVEHRLSGGGFYGKACAAWLTEHLGSSKALLTHSCTGALDLSALLLDIGPGDEVIMPSFTFSSTANAFVLRGAIPRFVDIRPDTLNIDEEHLSAAITARTRAIVPVHYAGYPCNMTAVMAIAKEHGLHVIEDAAQALLSDVDGRKLGTIGDLGCLSFHETKNIIAGEGGALLINDPALAERAEILWEKGTDRARLLRGEIAKYTWQDIGSSFAPSELTAAFLYAQLERADEIMARRRALHSRYLAGLAALSEAGVDLPDAHDGPQGRGNGHIFYLLTRSPAERDQLLAALAAEDINAIFHYVPLHSSPAGQRFGRSPEAGLPVTDRVAATLVRLPIFYEMTDAELDRVVDAVLEFYRKK
jgi:dTDP-4-amino-4,6-dideoxygalactose transaminase